MVGAVGSGVTGQDPIGRTPQSLSSLGQEGLVRAEGAILPHQSKKLDPTA